MTDMGDSVYSVTIDLTAGDTAAYYYITVGDWITGWQDYRETVPAGCDFSFELRNWEGDRAFVVPITDSTISYIGGSCDDIPEAVGIKNRDHFSQHIQLFPNPSQSYVTFTMPELSHAATIEILDMSGKIFRCIDTAVPMVTVDVSNMPKEFYLVKVTSGKNTSIEKLIPQ